MVSLLSHKRVFGGRYSDPCDLTVIENRVKLFEVKYVATKSQEVKVAGRISHYITVSIQKIKIP